MPVLMADFAAMDVQRALQVVPRQYSRVLAAVYIPKAESELSARLRMGIKRRLWHDSRVQGLRLFWGHYLRRMQKKMDQGVEDTRNACTIHPMDTQ